MVWAAIVLKKKTLHLLHFTNKMDRLMSFATQGCISSYPF